MPLIDEHITWYQSRFESFEQSLNGGRTSEVHAIRRDAMNRFTALGFPTTRQEEWRFTNISPIRKNDFQPILHYDRHGVSRKDIAPYMLDEAIHVVFINGIYSPEFSDTSPLPAGVIIGSLGDRLNNPSETIQPIFQDLNMGEENAFTLLNSAFLMDGGFISIPRGVVVDQPIQLLFVATDHGQRYTAQPKNRIMVGSGSQCKLIEMYIGLGRNTYMTNSVTELTLGDHSMVEHDKIQQEGIQAFHVGTTRVQMTSASRYTSNVISLGGSIVRNNLTVRFDAEGGECVLNGLSLARGTQVVDNHTVIDHAKPHNTSHELYKSILDGMARGIFNGKVFVRKNAQKTDAKQTNKTLLLSDDATMNTKPQLEIFADDVKCTHGATIGQLDDDQIFYLRSRGMSLDQARDILTSAFARDVIDRITIEPLCRQAERMILDRLTRDHLTSNLP